MLVHSQPSNGQGDQVTNLVLATEGYHWNLILSVLAKMLFRQYEYI